MAEKIVYQPLELLQMGDDHDGGGGGLEAAGPPEVSNKAEMMRVGPLFIKSSIMDDILNERKQELMHHPQVIEFLKRKKFS